MYARVATFESDPSKVDDAIAMVALKWTVKCRRGWRARRCSCSSTVKRARASE